MVPQGPKIPIFFKFCQNRAMLQKTLIISGTLTLARAGGGLMQPPPLRFFFRWPLHRLPERAEILHSLWGILRATFGEKTFDRIWSGHRAMTSLEEQCRAKFERNRVFLHF